MNLDCLITTYNYTKDQIIDMLSKMNLFTHTIVRNQCSESSSFSTTIDGQAVDVIFAIDKGTSKNRNELLKLSHSKFVVFSDDDVIFSKTILKTLRESNYEKYDGCVFNVSGKNVGRKANKVARDNVFRKCKWKDVSSTGVWRFVLKRDIALKICFDERIGPGTKFLCGEDSVFIRNVLKEAKIYLVGKNIATIQSSNSTWYKNIDTKEYLMVKGYVYKILYPFFHTLFILKFLFKNKLFSCRNFKICLKGANTIKNE